MTNFLIHQNVGYFLEYYSINNYLIQLSIFSKQEIKAMHNFVMWLRGYIAEFESSLTCLHVIVVLMGKKPSHREFIM